MAVRGAGADGGFADSAHCNFPYHWELPEGCLDAFDPAYAGSCLGDGFRAQRWFYNHQRRVYAFPVD